jgi:type IV pilus assembly protein PilC
MKTSLSKKDKLALVSNLGTMLNAGIPIVEAVDSLISDSKGNQKKILIVLKEDLNQGKKISQSFSKFPKAFDPVTVNLIKAAEQSGNLSDTLKELVIGIKKDMEFSEKIRGAITYPLFVMGVFVGVLLLILMFVIPRISSVFGRLNVELPLPTRVLITVSDFMTSQTIVFVVLSVVFIVGVVFIYKWKKSILVNVLVSLPLLNGLAKKVDLTRFNRSMALLLSSGIPITEALDLAQDVVVKKDVRNAVERAKKSITSGKKLSEGYKKSPKTVPSIMVRITEAGERSGTLDKSMEEISEYFDTEVTSSIRTLTSLLEPIMLVFVGLLVGGMMLAIIAPIYGLISDIGTR